MKSLAIINAITTNGNPLLVGDPYCFPEAFCWGVPMNALLLGMLFFIYRLKWSKLTFPGFFTLVLVFGLLTVVSYKLQLTQNIIILCFFVFPSLMAFTYILFYDRETKWKYFNAKGKRRWILEQAGWNVHKAVAQMDYLILNNGHTKDQIRVSKTWEFTTPLLGNLETESQKNIKDILHFIGDEYLREMTKNKDDDDKTIVFDGNPYSIKEMKQNIKTLSPVGLECIYQHVKKSSKGKSKN